MCQKTGIIKFCLMLISSDAEKQISLILSDINIIRCRTKDTIEFSLMLISSDAKKKNPSYHRILSDVNIIAALWVGHRVDPLPCNACRKRRLRQEQLAGRIKGLA